MGSLALNPPMAWGVGSAEVCMMRLGDCEALGFKSGGWRPLPGWGLLYVNPQKVLEFPSLAGLGPLRNQAGLGWRVVLWRGQMFPV